MTPVAYAIVPAEVRLVPSGMSSFRVSPPAVPAPTVGADTSKGKTHALNNHHRGRREPRDRVINRSARESARYPRSGQGGTAAEFRSHSGTEPSGHQDDGGQ